jgi:predicted phosphodiesterase
MKLRVISDMHMEFWDFNKMERVLEQRFPIMEDEADQILCCAGDIGLYERYASSYKPFFNIMGERFRAVICVPGNHSYYSSSLWGAEDTIWKDKKLPRNVHYLDNGNVVIDDVVFIGSCLWTNFNNSDPVAMMNANRSMNDFHLIRKAKAEMCGDYGQIISSNKLSPEDTVARHKASVAYITEILEANPDTKTVLVTHHGISQEAIHAKYKGDAINAAYVSDLSELVLDHPQLQYVFSGHTHESYKYKIGETTCICNPFGYYYQDENKNFNPALTVTI